MLNSVSVMGSGLRSIGLPDRSTAVGHRSEGLPQHRRSTPSVNDGRRSSRFFSQMRIIAGLDAGLPTVPRRPYFKHLKIIRNFEMLAVKWWFRRASAKFDAKHEPWDDFMRSLLWGD
jgi:hypothetical protein